MVQGATGFCTQTYKKLVSFWLFIYLESKKARAERILKIM